MPTSTTNYGFIKPNVNDAVDQDLWGGYLNTDLDDIDDLMLTASNTTTNDQTSNYTILVGDRNKIILCDATSAGFTVTLPPAATAGDGFEVSIKKVDSTSNNVTIDGEGAETIDGDATLVITTQYVSYTLVCDGSNWFRKTRSAAVTPKFVNVASSYVTTVDSTSAVIPQDNTIPQITDGKEFTTVSITPSSASNTIKGFVTLHFGGSVNNIHMVGTVFADAGANAIAVGECRVTDSSDIETLCFAFDHSPATTSAVTYHVRFGPSSGTGYVNQTISGQKYGGALKSGIVVQEIS
jgi:hypothetical protein